MFLTDLSIKRPVVASVMSIVLVIFGLVAFQEIQLMNYLMSNHQLLQFKLTTKELLLKLSILKLLKKLKTLLEAHRV
jgi:uncharacterized membrane protein (DUF373 family)